MMGPEVTTPGSIQITDLTPRLSCAVLECEDADPAGAFGILVEFLVEALSDPKQSVSVRITGQTLLADHTGVIDGLGSLEQLGFDGMFLITRERVHVPGWVTPGADVTDVTNELTLALRRSSLIALHTSISDPVLRKWTRQRTTPFRLVPHQVLAGTFPGDSTAVWLSSVQAGRSTKPDSKMLAGTRTQDIVNTIDDSASVMSAARVAFQPPDREAVLRGQIVTNARSRISWTAVPDLPTFFSATAEALDLIAKTITDGDPPVLFEELPVPENDLTGVHGAFDLTVALPTGAVPALDSDHDRRTELLYEHLLTVRGNTSSAEFTVDVGQGDAVEGSLTVRPVRLHDDIELTIVQASPTSPLTADVAEAVNDGDHVTVYYETGHAIRNGQVYRQRLDVAPFTNVSFDDFTGWSIKQEKPEGLTAQAVRDAIGREDDRSLFSWVVHRFDDGWLLCDDGAGEVADFLHLDHQRTLRAIHVKKAGSDEPRRGIAPQQFEVVVGQAVKNLRLLDNKALREHLKQSTIAAPAAWHDGVRVSGRDGFLRELEHRTAADRTEVVIVQPHMFKAVWQRARAASDAGSPTHDSRRLALLDLLLHSARRTVTLHWNDLTVIGAA